MGYAGSLRGHRGEDRLRLSVDPQAIIAIGPAQMNLPFTVARRKGCQIPRTLFQLRIIYRSVQIPLLARVQRLNEGKVPARSSHQVRQAIPAANRRYGVTA